MEKVAAAIQVKVLFFGRLKEIVSGAEQVIDAVEGQSIEHLFSKCVAAHPELARYRSSLVATRNQEFSAWDTVVHAGDEVAFLPPVSGG
jgi:molybdopterin converting factor small subunit